MRSLRLAAPGTGFSRPGGIYKLAGTKVPGTGKMSRMEVEQQSRCMRDAGKSVDPADPNVQRRVPRRRFRTMGGVLGDAGLGVSFHRGCFTCGDYRLDQERPDLD